MAYVPGCEHDVFISYAHIDDESLIAGEPGWGSGLVDKLETVVRQKLGSKDLRVWMDHELAGNAPLTPALLGTLRTTAALVVIMSPGYLASPWCTRERVVPGIERLQTGPSTSTEVRFFRRSEEPPAEVIARVLQKAGVPDVVSRYVPGFEDSKRIRKQHFEVWFTASAFQGQPRPRAAARWPPAG